MTQTAFHFTWRAGLLGFACTILTLFPPSLQSQERAPQVRITEPPPAKQGNPVDMYKISGRVENVQQVRDFVVVIYAYAGGQWFVQPFDYQPKTAIRNGRFETVTHGGSAYAALLVKSDYAPEKTMQVLPSAGGEIVAVHSVDGK